MRPEQLPRLSGPAIVCIQAGNVNTGAFDPVAEICGTRTPTADGCTSTARSGCGRRPRPRDDILSRGRRAADSWATDAHKWLNVPYDSGLAFVRDARRAAFGHGGDRRLSAEGNETARSVRLHAGALAAGSRGRGLGGAPPARPRRARRPDRAHLPLRAALRRRADGGRATRSSTRWCSTRCWCRSATRRTTRSVIADVQRDGTCWCGGTVVAGPHRHAHQRVVVGDDGRRRRAQPGGDPPRRGEASPPRRRGRGARVGPRLRSRRRVATVASRSVLDSAVLLEGTSTRRENQGGREQAEL